MNVNGIKTVKLISINNNKNIYKFQLVNNADVEESVYIESSK